MGMERIDSYDSSKAIVLFDNEPIDLTAVLTSAAMSFDGKTKLTVFVKADANVGDAHVQLDLLISQDGVNYNAPVTASDGAIMADYTGIAYLWKVIKVPACHSWKIVATGLVTNGDDIDLYVSVMEGANPI